MLPMDLPGYHIRAVRATEQCVVVTIEALGDEQVCPDCHQASRHLHSRYVRHIRDLPVQGRQTQITAHIRRFRCLNQACARKTFSEPLEGLAQRHAQRTDRMTATLLQLILSVSSTVGALLAWALGMEVSARTLLRVVDHGEWQAPTPRVLGVDDFAFRRGREYGTLLCDLERGKPIDLLLGRSKDVLLQWLKAHPGVEIIVRDRASSYADAAREGAPDAIQVADRFHLVRNVGDALKEVVDRQSWALPEPAPLPVSASEPPSTPPAAPDTVTARRVTRAEQRRAAAADRLRRRYEAVQFLHRSGRSIAQIRKETGLSRHTIRKYLASATVPKRAERRRVPSKLDPFVDYLGERWEAGCRNTKALYQEIITQGYSGSIQCVRRLLQPWRAQCPPPPRPQRPGPSRKEVHPAPRVTWKEMRWAVLRPPEHVDDTQRPLLQDFLSLHPALTRAYELAQRFHRLCPEATATSIARNLTKTHFCLTTDTLFHRTGHSYIKAKLKEIGGPFAGEMPGHLFFADEYYGFDDALYAGARLCRLVAAAGKPLSALRADVPRYAATPEVRVPCPDERKAEVVAAVRAHFAGRLPVLDVDGARVLFPRGWGLVRASNTQPVLVLRCEGRSADDLPAIQAEMEAALQRCPGIGPVQWQ